LEIDDGRVVISLAGIARFTVCDDLDRSGAFRLARADFSLFAGDFVAGHGETEVDRARLLATLRSYLIANNLSADWDRIGKAGTERLVNTLSVLSPYGPEEKQCLLEAPNLRARAEALVALAEMELAARGDGSGTSLQ
jgi:Lon protease-like protein